MDIIFFKSLISLRDGGICFSISLMRKLRHREIKQLVSGKLGTQLSADKAHVLTLLGSMDSCSSAPHWALLITVPGSLHH